MTDNPFMTTAIREFRLNKRLADKAMAQVSDEQFFELLGDVDNSIAIIVKHVAGNLRSRWRDFLTSDGEKSDRHRDTEFELGTEETRASLLERWEAGWQILFDALEPLTEVDLGREILIRGEPLSVLQAISRQMAHYAYHVGQIVFLARHLVGAERWQTLSIPKGKSAEFNAKPKSYLKRADEV